MLLQSASVLLGSWWLSRYCLVLRKRKAVSGSATGRDVRFGGRDMEGRIEGQLASNELAAPDFVLNLCDDAPLCELIRRPVHTIYTVHALHAHARAHAHAPIHALHFYRELSALALLNYKGHPEGTATVIYDEQGQDLVANIHGYAIQRCVRCICATPRVACARP